MPARRIALATLAVLILLLGGGIGAGVWKGGWQPAPKLADRKSTRLNSSHTSKSRMPSSA